VQIRNTFEQLKSKGDTLYFDAFVNWDGMQKVMAEGILKKEEMEQIWRNCVQDTQNPATYTQFLRINEGIRDLFNGEGEDDKDDQVDIWDPNVPLSELYEDSSLQQFRNYFDSVATTANPSSQGAHVSKKSAKDDALVSFGSYMGWTDVQELIEEGNLDSISVRELWTEAIFHKIRKQIHSMPLTGGGPPPMTVSNEMLLKLKAPGLERNTDRNFMVDFDTFVRATYRLEEIVDDVSGTGGQDSEARKEREAFYRKEFKTITNHDKLINYAQITSWEWIRERIEQGLLAEEELREMFNFLPKDFIADDDRSAPARGFAPKQKSNVEGISEDAFVVLCHEVFDIIEMDAALDEEDRLNGQVPVGGI
jgi:hypothetical protein